MARFLYKAKKGPQETVEGFVEAESESQAISKISAQGLFPSFILKSETEVPISIFGGAFFGKVRSSDLALFTRQLADLLEAGITILNALAILSKQTENKRLLKVIADIHDYIKTGNSFTAALGRHPSVFSKLYVSMVRSGEVSGTLESVLKRLSDFLEEEEEFKTKVQAALAYPILMAVVGIATGLVLLTFVMPRVVGIFEDMGQSLPFITVLLLAASKFIRGYWYIMAALVIFLFFVIRQLNNTPEGKSFFDRLRNRIPILGPFLKKVDIARFTRTLGTLLNNGVTILASLEIVTDIVSSELAKKDLKEAFNKVRDGSPLASALAGGRYFPLFVTNMIAVGEESGQVERNLLKIADAYERETDKMIKIISSLIEPFMILIMGGIVGFIVISILLPIFQISLIAR
ncbi:MAG: type II secretion system F family protein [Candidatus Omnitrophica bacterium]|nr:type II secretion system F family protein [Candidatus Omnitrophota bacterium]